MCSAGHLEPRKLSSTKKSKGRVAHEMTHVKFNVCLSGVDDNFFAEFLIVVNGSIFIEDMSQCKVEIYPRAANPDLCHLVKLFVGGLA